tara:strand:+ start:148 stop:639 length:492 start_codon:yes stop_codon:yes gene_type:complete
MKILFLQTGGTIDKDYPHSSNGWAFEIHEPAVKRIIQKLNPSFQYKIESVFKKDSLEINDKDRELLLASCKNANEDKIIITHGTDTIMDTAIFLRNIPNKTIVLTGAMRPEKFTDSDADLNIGMAISGVQTLPYGVYICMHGIIDHHKQIDRDSETGKYIIKK